MMGVGERIRKHGWRQGLILRAADLPEFLPHDNHSPETDYLMVVSQSCDLVNGNLSKEPYAVFLVLRTIVTPDPGNLHGKNPRLIHFADGDGRFFEARAWKQIFVPRERLVDQPVIAATEPDLRTQRNILDWLAKRFTRIAFPDAFNDLLKPKEGAIQKLLKKRHHLFTEILLGLEPFGELDEGARYEVACYLLTPAENDGDLEKLKDARLMAANLEEIFEECGVDVVYCSPVSESVLTLAELKELMRWDYDYLTFRDAAE